MSKDSFDPISEITQLLDMHYAVSKMDLASLLRHQLIPLSLLIENGAFFTTQEIVQKLEPYDRRKIYLEQAFTQRLADMAGYEIATSLGLIRGDKYSFPTSGISRKFTHNGADVIYAMGYKERDKDTPPLGRFTAVNEAHTLLIDTPIIRNKAVPSSLILAGYDDAIDAYTWLLYMPPVTGNYSLFFGQDDTIIEDKWANAKIWDVCNTLVPLDTPEGFASKQSEF